ncbi:MAG: PLP-dependent aminotransferase family protein [Coprococcus sp.]|uniref:MocR-like pyridoxine biosynthesis transcription factor PdxR n=1 Tax=unclassified Coprococcus TaxID=2684943 RepID=UPI001367E2F8|nr:MULTISPECIES: PLP-dependent aminotransferase family protein [unclassified Coprococcus]MEE0077424.1 PLP-dependent aminotransferase family protein [Coprococcus sp.]MZK39425.1 aminotransferase class I/II-fold pyridoxal phosphate-dependent enzyme [Coprococcus sp. BIOML-A1]MZK64455.1 aminotransferase class I/II-fold pyridoxal phosphate-dependent enzyme [Coprococcus sp. BIOML-A2]
MLTYSFDDRGMDFLYEHLYKEIKNDILMGNLKAHEKLPSKRALAAHLNVSVVTVENAYSQLLAEGYIYSKPKSGFYVCDVKAEDADVVGVRNACYTSGSEDHVTEHSHVIREHAESPGQNGFFADFVNNSTLSENFPFSTWTKLMRETMMDDREKLMKRSPSGGIFELRKAIADYLYQFRGMSVSPNQIIVGAGTEYLYGLIIQLLGRDSVYGVENPGYQKIQHIYDAYQVKCCYIDMDESGVNIDSLERSGADVVHISPSHHFPTGTVTPASRRYELLGWAAKQEGRYIIEDEYDSEFRLVGNPIPALQSIDASDKVIYMNTFSKSLSSTIRISYMVLPIPLMVRYNHVLSFYACTVSNFDQYTLTRFIQEGYLEKHINRMRKFYRNSRDRILGCIRSHRLYPQVTIKEENAGLHFLMEIDTSYTDREMVDRAAAAGINISSLSQYCHGKEQEDSHTLVINYSGIEEDIIEEACDRLLESVVRLTT